MELVVCYGRFNPPTIAHKELFDFLGTHVGETTDCMIATSCSFDKKNPLGVLEKFEILSVMSPDGVNVEMTYSSPFELIEELGPKYERIYVICGADRKKDYTRLQNYTETPIELMVIPRPKGSVSSTVLRKAAAEDDFDTFVKYYGGPSVSVVDVFNTVKERVRCLS